MVIADGADRIGDSTHMLKELLRQGAKNWGIPGITDPKAAAWLEQNAKVGDTVTVKIGGWYDENSGEPVEVTGKVALHGKACVQVDWSHGQGRDRERRVHRHYRLG
ncbi:MAG: MlrC C-terminal domain-containing protein [Bacillota bacterium]